MADPITKRGAYLKFPAPPGDTPLGLVLKNGPSSYSAISIATPPTGGFVVTAADLGLTSIIYAFPAVSSNGQYVAYPMPATAQNQAQLSVRYIITVANGGAETSGDLSAVSFLFFALGG